MAVSFESLATYETTQLALDKPLIAAQAIPISPDYAKWVSSGDIGSGTIATWTDVSAAANPARFAYDGHPGFIATLPSSSDSILYYALDLGALVEFDCAFVIGHNFSGLVVGLTIQVADDDAFTTNLTTVADFGSPSDNNRLAALSLVGGRVTARYVWLKVNNFGGGSIVPELGELILGRRRQLEYKPRRPYDIYAMSEDAEFKRFPNGVITKRIYSRRGRELAGDLWVTNDTYTQDLVEFFRACRGPFVWVENPSSAPASWHFMMREGGFAIPETDANLRMWRIAATEQGPESYYLDVEENG